MDAKITEETISLAEKKVGLGSRNVSIELGLETQGNRPKMNVVKPKIHKLPDKHKELVREEESYIRSEVITYLDRYFAGGIHSICMVIEDEPDGDFEFFRVGDISGRHTCGLLQDAIESVREQRWEYFDEEE